jgi:hypothetical protein
MGTQNLSGKINEYVRSIFKQLRIFCRDVKNNMAAIGAIPAIGRTVDGSPGHAGCLKRSISSNDIYSRSKNSAKVAALPGRPR